MIIDSIVELTWHWGVDVVGAIVAPAFCIITHAPAFGVEGGDFFDCIWRVGRSIVLALIGRWLRDIIAPAIVLLRSDGALWQRTG